MMILACQVRQELHFDFNSTSIANGVKNNNNNKIHIHLFLLSSMGFQRHPIEAVFKVIKCIAGTLFSTLCLFNDWECCWIF